MYYVNIFLYTCAVLLCIDLCMEDSEDVVWTNCLPKHDLHGTAIRFLGVTVAWKDQQRGHGASATEVLAGPTAVDIHEAAMDVALCENPLQYPFRFITMYALETVCGTPEVQMTHTIPSISKHHY